jgi:hypothetical protein
VVRIGLGKGPLAGVVRVQCGGGLRHWEGRGCVIARFFGAGSERGIVECVHGAALEAGFGDGQDEESDAGR